MKSKFTVGILCIIFLLTFNLYAQEMEEITDGMFTQQFEIKNDTFIFTKGLTGQGQSNFIFEIPNERFIVLIRRYYPFPINHRRTDYETHLWEKGVFKQIESDLEYSRSADPGDWIAIQGNVLDQYYVNVKFTGPSRRTNIDDLKFQNFIKKYNIKIMKSY
jgi:hypothetical protein